MLQDVFEPEFEGIEGKYRISMMDHIIVSNI